jgi:hypothetical protein
MGYFMLKMISEDGEITDLHNAYVSSSENDNSLPLDDKTRKVTLQMVDPKHGITNITRIYGETVCHMGSHIQGVGSRKAEEVRFSFAALLSSKQHNQRLDVVCLHNEEKDFSLIERSIIGHYKVQINNEIISCTVVSCTCIREGVGTYFQLKDTQNLTGVTCILDLGFGVANHLIISDSGKVEYYTTKPELSIMELVKNIGNSQVFQTYMKDYNYNLGSIAYALQKNITMGSIPRSEWDRMKGYAISEYYKKLKTYLAAPIANTSLFASRYVLTGGGAKILDSENTAFKTVFSIPKDAHIASLVGIFNHPELIKIKTK